MFNVYGELDEGLPSNKNDKTEQMMKMKKEEERKESNGKWNRIYA